MTKLRNTIVSFTTVVAGLAMASWSPASHACSAEPLIASVCIMGMSMSPGRYQAMNNTYMLAQGQVLSVSQYVALYSLLGTTFGGTLNNNFNLPDLRGKIVVGYDPRDPTRQVGNKGGSATIKLTVAQLPPHTVTISNPAVPLNLKATTTLTSLSATADLGGVKISGPTSGLTIKAVSGSNGKVSPSGNYLGKAGSSSSAIYSDGAPDVTLNAGAIAGDLTVILAAGITAPVTIKGDASTTVTGSAAFSGTSAAIGSGADVPVMPPYLVLPYYIAYSGIYPSSD